MNMVNEEFKASVAILLTVSFSRLVQPFINKINDKMIYTGKLAIINDPELKFRVIAMVDYLSQFILKSVHKGLFSLLRKLPQDRTFTQDPRNSWSSDGEPYYSLDLTAATDRFPVTLQKKLLLYVYKDKDFVDN